MSYKLPNGSKVEIGVTYGDVTDIDAVSNANPAVATVSASHALSTGDFIVVDDSGWSGLKGKAIKIGTVAGNSAPLLDINSSSTTRFPAGQGTGTFREVLTWQQVLQVLNPQSSGGEQQFTQFQPLESDVQFELPTVRTPYRFTMDLGDDPDLAGYQAIADASDDGEARAVRVTLRDGSVILFNAIITVSKMPTLTINEVQVVNVTMALQAEPTRPS